MSVESLLESLSNYAVGSYAYDSAVGGIKGLFDEQEKEIETLRMQLSACGVAAMSNTRASAAGQRLEREHPYWSDSYQSVVDAVEREMGLREDIDFSVLIGIGFGFGKACAMLDTGEDPRAFELAGMAEEFRRLEAVLRAYESVRVVGGRKS